MNIIFKIIYRNFSQI